MRRARQIGPADLSKTGFLAGTNYLCATSRCCTRNMGIVQLRRMSRGMPIKYKPSTVYLWGWLVPMHGVPADKRIDDLLQQSKAYSTTLVSDASSARAPMEEVMSDRMQQGEISAQHRGAACPVALEVCVTQHGRSTKRDCWYPLGRYQTPFNRWPLASTVNSFPKAREPVHKNRVHLWTMSLSSCGENAV